MGYLFLTNQRLVGILSLYLRTLSRFVVIAFDSEEQVKAWYNAPAIKDVNAARLKTAKSRAFMVEGLAQ